MGRLVSWQWTRRKCLITTGSSRSRWTSRPCGLRSVTRANRLQSFHNGLASIALCSSQVDDQQYPTLNHFLEDLQLILRNAEAYNPQGNRVRARTFVRSSCVSTL
jgi:hypothetical protein